MADAPKARKVTVFVTDDEWRAIRIAAAAHDTSIQGYVTNAVVARLQGQDRTALDAAQGATKPPGQPKRASRRART